MIFCKGNYKGSQAKIKPGNKAHSSLYIPSLPSLIHPLSYLSSTPSPSSSLPFPLFPSSSHSISLTPPLLHSLSTRPLCLPPLCHSGFVSAATSGLWTKNNFNRMVDISVTSKGEGNRKLVICSILIHYSCNNRSQLKVLMNFELY